MARVSDDDLRAIAPYTDTEFRAALQRVLAHPAFERIAGDYFPGVPVEGLRQKAMQLQTIAQFQERFIDSMIQGLQKRTTAGVTISGGEQRPKLGRYLYLSNHRDIILDPAIFTRAIHSQGYSTPQICLGDNLLTNPLVVDLIKMNKGITVKRDLAQRELLRWSFVLSEWIRRQITSLDDSVWIAQREGRAKDGNDETQPGVLKMLALSGEGDLLDRLAALHIVPVANSYEYDPSDLEKARELAIVEKTGTYVKTPGEDMAAMYRGIHGYKGGVHIEVGTEISDIIEQARSLFPKNEQARFVASGIDQRVRKQYRNWPSNYIAYDLMNNQPEMSDHYTAEKKAEFTDRMEARLAEVPESELRNDVRRHFLSMYATPVKNQRG